MTKASQPVESTVRSKASATLTPSRRHCYGVALAATLFAAGCVGDAPELPEDQEALDAFDDDTIEPPTDLTIAYSTGNLLTANPGFESRLEYSGWTFYGMVARVQTPHTGSWAARVADTSTDANYLASPRVKCWPYVTYVASAYSRWRGGGLSTTPQRFEVRFLDEDGWEIAAKSVSSRSSTWIKNTVTVKAPANCASIEINVGDWDWHVSRGTYDWDDFRLYEQ
jgi:hypothetical protein